VEYISRYGVGMTKRRREPFDPLSAQPRTPPRRPGSFNEQTDDRPDPNVEFIPVHSSATADDPTLGLRLFRALSRAWTVDEPAEAEPGLTAQTWAPPIVVHAGLAVR